MDTNNIDPIFRKAVNDSENFYSDKANDAKERIWGQIQLQKQAPSRLVLIRWLVAACIILLFISSVASVSFFNTKKAMNQLISTNNSLTENKLVKGNLPLHKSELLTVTPVNNPDTVFIEKEVIVPKTLITTKHITDTVYIREIVYIEKEQSADLITAMDNNFPTDTINNANIYNTEILISNNEPDKKLKGNKIQLRFGGNKNRINSGTLAFKTKL